MATKSIPNGSADAPVELSALPPVVGINFGNSYASLAVFTKVGVVYRFEIRANLLYRKD